MQKHYKKIGRLIAIVLVDAIFFSLINPQKAPALVIIIGFGLVVVTFYFTLDLLLGLIQRAVSFSPALRKRLQDSITMLVALLLAMQSIGQLTAKDLLAFIPLVLVLTFYLSYQRKENA